MKVSDKNGFVAITSAAIIAAILMAITLTISYTGFQARFNILNVEYKDRSSYLAEACVAAALLKLAADKGYIGGETVSISSFTCEILSLIPDSPIAGEFMIKTKASFPQSGADRAVTNLVVTARSSDLKILSWEEIPRQD